MDNEKKIKKINNKIGYLKSDYFMVSIHTKRLIDKKLKELNKELLSLQEA